MDRVAGSSHHHPPRTQYMCHKCRKTFRLSAMYACYHGHYMCRQCYQKMTSGSNYNIVPNDLAPAESKSQATNQYIDQKIFLEPDQELGGSAPRNKTMFPNPSSYQQNTIDMHNSLISLATIYKPSLLNFTSSSRKPIVCPQYDCRKTIAVSLLGAHFYHEHKQVTTIVTELEMRNCLEFNFKDLRNKTRNLCLLLINLRSEVRKNLADDESGLQDRSTYSKLSRIQQNSQQPFFIVIAAKMPCGNYEEKSDTYNHSHFRSPERVFFYVTSNVIGNYSYTIAISSPIQSVRVKYFGPLLSVNEDFRKLCEEGKGLVLNHHQINGMSNYCCCPVNLDLILHEREDQSFDCNLANQGI